MGIKMTKDSLDYLLAKIDALEDEIMFLKDGRMALEEDYAYLFNKALEVNRENKELKIKLENKDNGVSDNEHG